MKTYEINGKTIEFDNTKTYMDFYLKDGNRILVCVDFSGIFEDLISGTQEGVTLDTCRHFMIYLDRWTREVNRKRFYRQRIKDGSHVFFLSTEYWFEDFSDEEADKIFTNLENTGQLARRFLELFFPEDAEKCKQDHHPAEKYYVAP